MTAATAARQWVKGRANRRAVQRFAAFWNALQRVGNALAVGVGLVIITTDQTLAEMKKILGEITDGSFAKEWMAEYDAGLPNHKRLYQENTEHRVEQTGAKLRPMMSWIGNAD